ncbi:MAG: hypothetical protein JJU36_02070 [Phycisphaeraceae bacterium]|nr:hypothetical protein [Phycisphaeraceae bacterium]
MSMGSNGSVLARLGLPLAVIVLLLGAAVWTAGLWRPGMVAASAGSNAEPAGERESPPLSTQEANRIRHRLPDFSTGQAGVLGPFYWGRAMDVGEDARFSDERGVAQREGEHLWLFNFNRTPVQRGDERGLNDTFIHARNNFVIRHPDMAFAIQPRHFIHNTSGAHNSKIAIGYVPEDFRFEHGDNTDLEHLIDAPRVIVFIPVRHRGRIPDSLNQSEYFINPNYSAQTPCVIEFEPGEIIMYDWFRNPSQLHERILFDLKPHIADGQNMIRPGVDHPIIRFDLVPERQGGWILRILRNGKGREMPEKDEDWDLVITDQSPGAKPFSVDLDAKKNTWAMSLFSPGGGPADTSEIIIGLHPYGRDSGRAAPWPDNRADRVRSAPLGRLPQPTPGLPSP